jgi:hypothetical protein
MKKVMAEKMNQTVRGNSIVVKEAGRMAGVIHTQKMETILAIAQSWINFHQLQEAKQGQEHEGDYDESDQDKNEYQMGALVLQHPISFWHQLFAVRISHVVLKMILGCNHREEDHRLFRI